MVGSEIFEEVWNGIINFQNGGYSRYCKYKGFEVLVYLKKSKEDSVLGILLGREELQEIRLKKVRGQVVRILQIKV